MPDLTNTFWISFFGMISLVTLAVTLGKAWTGVHRANLEAASRREMLQRGFSADEILRILERSGERVDPPNVGGMDAESLEEIVSLLASNEAAPAIIEEVLTSLRAVDAPTQQLVSRAVQAFYAGAEDRVEGEQILAIVRPLCQSGKAVGERVLPVRSDRLTPDPR